jgi:hypothetical protein
LQTALKIIAQYDLLILAEDNVGYETAVWIKAAHSRGIPAVIVPFTVATALEPAESIFGNRAYSIKKIGNRLAGKFYPHWVYTHKGRKLVRLPAPQILAKEWLGISSPAPWIMNAGDADAIAVESEMMLRHYRREGIADDRLVMTGALTDDRLVATRSDACGMYARLCEQLGFDRERPLILCALPPDQLLFNKDQTNFNNYSEMVEFWIRTLMALPGWNVVLKLHPRTSLDEIAHIEQFGVKVSSWDTVDLVPLCRIFVASVSATIRWAIACGIPVINFDVYRLGYTDYAEAKGVLTVEKKSEFSRLIRKLAGDPLFYKEIRTIQEAAGPAWGILDGKSADRMLCLFSDMMKSSSPV